MLLQQWPNNFNYFQVPTASSSFNLFLIYDRYLSYLPLAHMFERVSQATVLMMGGKIGFYQGDIKKLVDDMKELKPTIFCTVPRLLNRIYSKINENLEKSSPIKRAIFKYSFAQKEKEVCANTL